MPRWRLFYHLVWATRGREPSITPAREPEVHRVLRQTARSHGIIVHAVGGVADHVHLAVSIPPSLAVATAVQRIKGGSARTLNATFGDGFGWQGEYGVDTFGERHLAAVVAYIERQHRHHAEQTLWPSIEEIPTPGTPATGEG